MKKNSQKIKEKVGSFTPQNTDYTLVMTSE